MPRLKKADEQKKWIQEMFACIVSVEFIIPSLNKDVIVICIDPFIAENIAKKKYPSATSVVLKSEYRNLLI